jgi:hypothetical protein
MGDRANVYVHEGDEPGVYLYTHSSGSGLPTVVASAIRRGRTRWDDMPYLARIIFDEMIGPDEHGRETGYGISAVVTDGDNRIVDVDTSTGILTLRGYGDLGPDGKRGSAFEFSAL